jgi:signal transduction histidine kinase
MLRCFTYDQLWVSAEKGIARSRPAAYLICSAFLILSGLLSQATGQAVSLPQQIDSPATRHLVTDVSGFSKLKGEDYLEGCDFHLNGVVTLVDTNRGLVVLQDSTGAVALHFPLQNSGLCFGRKISLAGTNCSPYFERFPDYPYHPTIKDVRPSFEAPVGGGDYYLTRMRGYLHPPVTGEYSFWIASDNSSELWLSTDASPSKVRKIAFLPRFNWVSPHDWSRYPSQHSESIWLQAGQAYYIEAFQEQTTIGDNLSVAWQGPETSQSVIDGRYLTPCDSPATNGILREFWKNYTSGDLSDIGGARPFQSALSVENASVQILGQGSLPKPEPIASGQPSRPADNYRWTTTQGLAKFIGVEDNLVCFRFDGNPASIQVYAPRVTPAILKQMHNTPVQVEGVCEYVFNENGNLVPGKIWISETNDLHLLESAGTNINSAINANADSSLPIKTNLAMPGFYSTRGTVTFNDRVLGQDYLIVQEDEQSAILVSKGESTFYQKNLKVGEWVDLGGALQRGKYLPVLAPLVITELGWRSLPVPISGQLGVSLPTDRAGKWSELEGVVHSVNTNGTLSALTREGPVYFWVGGASANDLAGYVDAKLRVCGAFLPNLLNAPLLLVPSRQYLDVEEPASENPFEIPNSSVSALTPELLGHRIKVTGEIINQDADSFFLQDASGGIRIPYSNDLNLTNGEKVEVLGFAEINGSARTLTEPLVRPADIAKPITPNNLDLSEALSAKQDATLIVTMAALLAQKTSGNIQLLELQEGQRVFAATLPVGNGLLPVISPGSRVQVIGVCDNETTTSPSPGDKTTTPQSLASLEILMRQPGDVTVISGPPWWTWKRTVILVGALLTTIVVTLLWIHLLGRRLARQQAAQLEFLRHVLERLEDERRRIAVNLHDSLGQTLLAIKNQALLAIQRPSGHPAVRERLDDISNTISQALDEIRHITHGLRPYQLDRLGLTQAIRASVSRAAEGSPISFAVRVEDIDGLFDKDAEIHVYRIVQEAVTNVVKHSGATEAAVVIKKRTATISLSIRDNGRGFDASKPLNYSQNMGLGLSGVAERVRILGGTFNLDSKIGEGTSLVVEAPLAENKNETRTIGAHRG